MPPIVRKIVIATLAIIVLLILVDPPAAVDFVKTIAGGIGFVASQLVEFIKAF